MLNAKDIHERWKKLQPVKEGCNDCEKSDGCKCEDGECKCESAPVPSDAGKEKSEPEEKEDKDDSGEDDEENAELEKSDPVELQEDEGDAEDAETSGLDDEKVFNRVMNRILDKPTGQQVVLYNDLIKKLAAMINELPNGSAKLRKIVVEFKKEKRL